MRNTEDDDTDDEVEDIDLDHYKDDPRLKIFGNPTVKKTQSFSYTKKATPVYEALVTSGCQNTPSNTPHSSSPLSTSPVSSPALNPRQMAVALALQQRGLSKSESCSGMASTKTKTRSDSPLVVGFVRPEIRPTIVLTSPQESPEMGGEFNQLQCLPDVLDKKGNKEKEEDMIMSMETDEKEEEEEEEKQTNNRLDQLSASKMESNDIEMFSGGLREQAGVPPRSGGEGRGGDGQRAKRKTGMGKGPPPPPPKSAPPPLPVQIL